MGSTVPHDEESARCLLLELRGPVEASDIIAHADTRASLIQTATRLNFWPAHEEQMRAARKVARVLYPGEDIPPPKRGAPPGDPALFTRGMLKFGASLSSQLTARELMALALIVGVEPEPQAGSRGWHELTRYQREEWAETTRIKWEAIRTRNMP